MFALVEGRRCRLAVEMGTGCWHGRTGDGTWRRAGGGPGPRGELI